MKAEEELGDADNVHDEAKEIYRALKEKLRARILQDQVRGLRVRPTLVVLGTYESSRISNM